ncbi:hypothetical protein [Streptomyces sp. FH025]|uniref:hypothetical protein n=1 Tax=Streptomyces sp. FH025 TaxID=2815937 RepID=UPI001A9E4A8B|nr:hypothetical protein [Streptomyces sp. FH025]MBO1417863.1 hypothetical protein [Streptomyces sp. FH025]
MRRSRLALSLTLAIAAASTLVAADVVQDESIRSVSLPVLRDPQAQQKLHLMTDPVQDWVESGDPAAAGYTGTVIDASNQHADIYWKGEAPAKVRELLDAHASSGYTVDVHPSAYSRAQMRAAIDKFTAAVEREAWTSIGPQEDGAAIAITYSPAKASRLTGGDTAAQAYSRRAAEIAGMPVTATVEGTPMALSGSRHSDGAPYYAGAEVSTSKAEFCSTAFSGWKDNKKVLLTAAHCGGGRYYNGTAGYIGDLYATGAGLDVGMIAINGNGGGRFYDGPWSDNSGSSRRTYGVGRNNVGDLICLSGAQSGWKCDVEIKRVDVETTNNEGTKIKPVDVAESKGGDRRAIAAKGDSGGPALANPSGANGDMEARGVIVAGRTEVSCPAGSTAHSTTCYSQVLYVPMTPVVQQMGFSIS